MSVPQPPKTVLVADDTAFVRDRFKSAIEAAGHRAVLAATAPELLASVKAEGDALDLLVIDLRLPQSTGVDLVRQIRKLDDGRLPILVFSGTVTSVDEVRELAALGVAGYVNEYSAVQHILPTLAPHIYPDDYNRRSSPRVVVGMPVSYRYGQTIAAALTLNLSRGGVSIRTTSPLPADSEARLRFRLPGSSKDIEAEAKVCWSSAREGMGLQFQRVDPDDQAAINDFVDAHFFQTRKV
ncbi:MAG: PilZ domain-containing protein [Acidobacteriota bacterium]